MDTHCLSEKGAQAPNPATPATENERIGKIYPFIFLLYNKALKLTKFVLGLFVLSFFSFL